MRADVLGNRGINGNINMFDYIKSSIAWGCNLIFSTLLFLQVNEVNSD